MSGPIRHVEGWPATVLEIAPCKAHISVDRFLWGPIPGLMIRGRYGCNRDGRTSLMMVEAVGFEPTRR
jgi:hypothetical protein